MKGGRLRDHGARQPDRLGEGGLVRLLVPLEHVQDGGPALHEERGHPGGGRICRLMDPERHVRGAQRGAPPLLFEAFPGVPVEQDRGDYRVEPGGQAVQAPQQRHRRPHRVQRMGR
ncbi:hypothetical protein ACGFZK_00240 [Streptomyces sp. NPDC048257]|uniref:hypothetical protein n=1 Tax=Streptomyces sp. NPDC048257 TaxID=3365526 RepID=UPI003713E7A2